MSEQLSELYPVALEMGILAETFWNLSVNEIFDTLANIRKRLLREEKQRIMDNFIQAQVIAVDISALFAKDGKIAHPWDYYPELFKKRTEGIRRSRGSPPVGRVHGKKEGRTTPNGTIDISINLLRKREEVRPWETHFIRCR
ncbi:hypothetical protein [Blautia massiliensis (ex Durand et al. 2017)]|uniref:hypothetical protein n=1 Tax=Blautia massiliensis (ex Durand et al. 2017) TaxID=1737424 RepID=UPI003995FCB5